MQGSIRFLRINVSAVNFEATINDRANTMSPPFEFLSNKFSAVKNLATFTQDMQIDNPLHFLFVIIYI